VFSGPGEMLVHHEADVEGAGPGSGTSQLSVEVARTSSWIEMKSG
jgi:hypothetical protein